MIQQKIDLMNKINSAMQLIELQLAGAYWMNGEEGELRDELTSLEEEFERLRGELLSTAWIRRDKDGYFLDSFESDF